MYFDAVEDILKKLADPKLKGSARANLSRQLKDIDPDGVIQKFVNEGGERPDLSGIIGQNKKSSKKRRKTWGAEKERPKPKKKRPTASDSSSNKDQDEDQPKAKKIKKREEETPEEPPTPPPPRERIVTTTSVSYSSMSISWSSSNGNNPNDKLLNALYGSLESAMPDARRQAVCEYINNRLNLIGNEDKRNSAATKISEKLGDSEYWINFADQYEL